MAITYANIGTFYRDIANNVIEASDRGQYKPLFENLQTLLQEVALNEGESEIVRLELLEMARSAIQQYATKFKVDGIAEEQLQSMYGVIAETVKSIDVTTDKTEEKKNKTISLLDDTESAIKTAYGTSKGGTAS
jgi:serine/threonine-protein kinase